MATYKIKFTSKGKNNTWTHQIDADGLIDAVLRTRAAINEMKFKKEVKPSEKPVSVNVIIYSDHEPEMKTFTIYNVTSHEAWNNLRKRNF